MAKPGFQVVEDDPPPAQNAALGMLFLSLKALSQRALTAISDLFTLATVGSVWWLYQATPFPEDKQLISLGSYAVFVLAINIIVRRK